MDILIYSLIFYGISYCIVYAAGPFNIFTKYREIAESKFPSNLGDSVKCMFCTPFQLGLLFSLINYFLLDNAFPTPSLYCDPTESYWYISVIFDGAFTASVVYLIDTVQCWFEGENEEEDE